MVSYDYGSSTYRENGARTNVRSEAVMYKISRTQLTSHQFTPSYPRYGPVLLGYTLFLTLPHWYLFFVFRVI